MTSLSCRYTSAKPNSTLQPKKTYSRNRVNISNHSAPIIVAMKLSRMDGEYPPVWMANAGRPRDVNFSRRPGAFRQRIVVQSPQHERLCFDPELKMLSKATVAAL